MTCVVRLGKCLTEIDGTSMSPSQLVNVVSDLGFVFKNDRPERSFSKGSDER